MKQQYIHLCAKEYIDGAIWAITTFSKQLVRINVKTGEANIELELMEEGKQQNYAEIVGLGEERFLLIPRNNKQLLYVDVRKNEQFFVDVECEEETDELCAQWIGKWQNDNFAYLFPGNSNYILKIDKTEYKFGEAINVSINVSEYYPNYTDSDWFALYKVGDTYYKIQSGYLGWGVFLALIFIWIVVAPKKTYKPQKVSKPKE